MAKNRGPLLTGFAKGLVQAIPERFLAAVQLTKTSQPVPNGTDPTALSATMLESSVEISNTNEDKLNEVIASAFPTLVGQDYDKELNVAIPYTEDIVLSATAPIGTTAKEINPINGTISVVKSSNLSSIAAALNTVFIPAFSPTRVNLPDTMVEMASVFSEEYGQDSGSGGGSSWSAESSVSGSIAADLGWTIRPGYSGYVDGTSYLFYLPVGGITKAAILAKTSATAWPIVRPVGYRLVLEGASKSISARYSRSQTSWSSGHSLRTGVQLRPVTIPPTLHGALTFGQNQVLSMETTGISATLTGSYDPSGWERDPGYVAGGPEWLWIVRTPITYTIPNPLYIADSIEAAISSGSLAATNPTVFPTGEFLTEVAVRLYGYGYMQVYAQTAKIESVHV